MSAAATLTVSAEVLTVSSVASLLMKAVVVAGSKTSEGKLIEAVALPWFDIIEGSPALINHPLASGAGRTRAVHQDRRRGANLRRMLGLASSRCPIGHLTFRGRHSSRFIWCIAIPRVF
jgi:hypothetical protein